MSTAYATADDAGEIDALATELKSAMAAYQQSISNLDAAMLSSGFSDDRGMSYKWGRTAEGRKEVVDRIQSEIDRLDAVKGNLENLDGQTGDAYQNMSDLADAIEELGGDPHELAPGLIDLL